MPLFDWLKEKAETDKKGGSPPLTTTGTGGLTQEEVNWYDTNYGS